MPGTLSSGLLVHEGGGATPTATATTDGGDGSSGGGGDGSGGGGAGLLSVAVVGAGPCGLIMATALRRRGIQATIF
jgi:NADPH-dependent glutamate synthase beta subunit-like oxidoreductase